MEEGRMGTSPSSHIFPSIYKGKEVTQDGKETSFRQREAYSKPEVFTHEPLRNITA